VSSPATKLPPQIAARLSDEISLANEAWLWLKTNLIEIAGAVAVLVVGVILVRLLSRAADRALTRSGRIEPTVARFLSNIIKYALWVVLAITVLTQFGVQTTSIIAALGGLALAVGLALQGTLSNVAAGVMILIQRPFRVGEAITAGTVSGVVQGIGLFTTEITQVDGLYVMVPNNELWNKPITNFSRLPTRRFELLIGISYADSIATARAEMLAIAAADQRVMSEPAPVVFVAALSDGAVRVGLRVWCAIEDYLALSWELTEAVKHRFDTAGITIAVPPLEVNLNSAGSAPTDPADASARSRE
jgi:small conductance mechanosensitive channel